MIDGFVLVLLGAPGSGKGTVARYLMDNYEVCYFSTGDLLRNEVKKRSNVGQEIEETLGSGGLVSDRIVNEIVIKNVEEAVQSKNVVVLDGYPRTESQAYMLDGLQSGALRSVIRVIELDVDPEEVVARISRRRTCSRCGNIFGTQDAVSVCSCGGELVKRKDDEEVVVRRRLVEYRESTLPLIKYYSDRVTRICGEGSREEVAQRVEESVYGLEISKRR